MLGGWNSKGFLIDIAEDAGKCAGKEWYAIDCVYFEERLDLEEIFPGGGYPARYDVIIEHENGEKVEEEWWKLLMWRAPLKVLIFNDFNDSEKEKIETRAKWLGGKLESLTCMARKAHKNWPGRKDEDEYLIVVGNRRNDDEPPRWRWFHMLREDQRIVEFSNSSPTLASEPQGKY